MGASHLSGPLYIADVQINPTLVQTIVAGGVAGNITVTGILPTDTLVAVLDIAGADLTSEFTITAADTINNAAGTSSSASQLLVTYSR